MVVRKMRNSTSTPRHYMNNSLTPITGLLSSTTQVTFSSCLLLHINLQCVLRLVLMVSCCCGIYHAWTIFTSLADPRDGTCPFSLHLTCRLQIPRSRSRTSKKCVYITAQSVTAWTRPFLVQPPLTPMTGLPRTRSRTFMKCVWLYV